VHVIRVLLLTLVSSNATHGAGDAPRRLQDSLGVSRCRSVLRYRMLPRWPRPRPSPPSRHALRFHSSPLTSSVCRCSRISYLQLGALVSCLTPLRCGATSPPPQTPAHAARSTAPPHLPRVPHSRSTPPPSTGTRPNAVSPPFLRPPRPPAADPLTRCMTCSTVTAAPRPGAPKPARCRDSPAAIVRRDLPRGHRPHVAISGSPPHEIT
jgi:hypothetical protein